MKIGYARTSKYEQNLDLQQDALKNVGCDKIFVDQVSGKIVDRPGFNLAMEVLRKGDILIVWRLDRLGRSLKHLIELIGVLEKRGIGFQSLQETIDTTSSSGKLIFHIFGALAEFERNLIRERTMAGLASARARGRSGGRPRKLTSSQQKLVVRLYKEETHLVKEICQMLKISKQTFYNYLKKENS